MADFDVTLGSQKGNLNVEFDKPTQDLTLKNQAATKTNLRDFNDVDSNTFQGAPAANGESILVYNANTKLFQLRSGNIRLRENPAHYSGLKYTAEGAFIPDTNNAYDLGSPGRRFRTLFLSGETIKLGNLNLSDTGETITITKDTLIDGVIQNVIIGTLSTQTLNTSNFEAANLVANTSFTIETDQAFFNRGFTVKQGVIQASNTHLHANNISIRNNLNVNGAIILRGSTINLGDGGDVINLGASVNNSIIPTTTNTFNIGAPAQKYANVFTTSVKGLQTPTENTDAANKLYVDNSIGNISTTADGTTLGSDFNDLNDGASVGFQSGDSVLSAIDNINETTFNIFKNTYVRDVTFSADKTSGGAGTTVTLTLTVTGNPNAFDINWGDGTTDSNVTDTTPSHTYTSNAGSPYTVQVTAKNTGAISGSKGSSASFTRSNFITIFLADPVPSFTIHDASSGGSVVTTAVTGTPVYLNNTTTNIPNTAITATFSVNWGDGTSIEGIDGKTENGGPQGGRLEHTYTNASGTGRHTITLAANTFSAGDPSVLPLTATALIKVFDASIASPNHLGTKTISLNTSSVGTNPRVASGFTTNGVSGTNAGDNVTRYTTSGAIATAAMGTFFFQADGGTVSAFVDGSADGQKAITNANDEGTFTSLIIDDEQDYNSFDADGNTVAVNSRIYAPGLFEGYKARISKSNFSTGLHSLQLQSTAGNTNTLKFIRDDVTITPTTSVGSATLTQASAGTLSYISGIPYYTNDATLTLAGVTVQSFTGQTFQNTTSPVVVENSTDLEGTSGNAIGTNNFTYANIDGSTTMLDSGTPKVNIGTASPYALGNLTVNVNGGGKRVERLQVKAKNSNGTGSAAILASPAIQAYNGSKSFDETAIPVSDSLGAGFDNDGKRIHSLTGGAVAFSNSTDYFATQAFTGAQTVAGTTEAIVRYDTLKHFTTDLSSGYLPAGPDLNTGRSGAQHFVFAFKRTTVSRFSITLTGKVSGLFVAVPNTAMDSASGINGWGDASIQYAGSGVPGSDTSNGGNGSNGIAETGADRIIDGTSYSNQTFTMTLGTVSSSNSFNNQILISIVLNSDDSLTALSIGVPS
tara:strand:+ start:4390 stop:7671 length:3282 start_codon:yes stop_codon:yes gene_type:complete